MIEFTGFSNADLAMIRKASGGNAYMFHVGEVAVIAPVGTLGDPLDHHQQHLAEGFRDPHGLLAFDDFAGEIGVLNVVRHAIFMSRKNGAPIARSAAHGRLVELGQSTALFVIAGGRVDQSW